MTQKFVETFFVSRQVAGICKGPCVLRKAGIFFLQSSCCEFHMPTGSGLSEKAFRAVVPVFYILIRISLCFLRVLGFVDPTIAF